MPEGPSLVLLREELARFEGEIVKRVSGNTKIDLTRMLHRRVRSVRTWGKHLLFEFDDFSLRIHLLLYGRCRVATLPTTNRGDSGARVSLEFKDARLDFYACSAKFVEGRLDDAYEWHADVMSDEWDPAAARAKLRSKPDAYACDALLDQTVFSGVGNITKSEVLFRTKIHPLSKIGCLPARKMVALVADSAANTVRFSMCEAGWHRETFSTCSEGVALVYG